MPFSERAWGYFPLDFVAHRDRPHVPGDIVSLMVGIEFARERADLVAPLWETVRRLTDDELRTTVARWLGRMDEHCNLNLPGLEDLFAMQDVTELTSRLDETVEEWRRDAVTEGQRVVLARQARLRCVGPPNIDIADPDALFAVIDRR